MYFYDLREAMVNQFDGDIREALEFINEMIEELKRDGLENYEEKLKNEAIYCGLCPNCFGKFNPIAIEGDKFEAWGTETMEIEYVLVCEECGEVVEDDN